MGRMYANLAIDGIGLVIAVLLVVPGVTGLWIHEWGALVLAAILFVHLVVHADWIVSTARGFRKVAGGLARVNLVVDALILVATAVSCVSGIMISSNVLPTFGLFGPEFYLWQSVHAVIAKVFLALMIVHLLLHVQWIARTLKHGGASSGSGRR